jgi:hypothetical protein
VSDFRKRQEALRREQNEAFGDAVYGAWKSGLNSDAVDMDRVFDDVAEGASREEAASREVRRLRESERA